MLLSFKPFTQRVRALSHCSTDVSERIDAMQSKIEVRRAGTEVCVRGAEAKRSFAVVSGWLMRTRLLADGRRQVLGFILPGDAINLSWHANAFTASDVECITDATLASIDGIKQEMTQGDFSAPLCSAIRASLAMDEMVALGSISRLARQSAYERLGLLLLELRSRLLLVHMSDGKSFHMPITQQVLSDALGLSIVHVNRTLMQLQRDGLVERRQRQLILPDPDGLAAVVDYVPPEIALPEIAHAARNAPQPVGLRLVG